MIRYTTFNFPKLPKHAQEVLIQQLDLIDLFNFSLLSPKWKSLISALEIPADSIKWTLCSDTANTIFVKSEKRNDLRVTVKPVYPKEWEDILVGGAHVKRTIDGISVLTGPILFHRVNVYCESEKDFGRLSETLSKHVLEIFRVRDYSLTATNFRKENILYYLTQNTRHFKSINVTFEERRKDLLPMNEVIRVILAILVEGVTVDDHFYLNFPIHEDYRYTRPFKHPEVHLDNATWLSMYALMYTKETKILTATLVEIAEERLVEVLKKWLNKEWEKLESIYLEYRHPVKKSFFKTLSILELPGVARIQNYNSNIRPRIHGDSDCARGLDIVRTDGMMATLNTTNASFGLYVWHSKYLTTRNDVF